MNKKKGIVGLIVALSAGLGGVIYNESRKFRFSARQKTINKRLLKIKAERKPSEVQRTNNLFQVTKIDSLPRDSVKVENYDNIQSYLSQITGAAIQNSIISNSYSGLLRCNVSTTELMKVANGVGYRGNVIKDGKIVEQAKFFENGVSLPTAMAVFQIASIATGLYYQYIITKRLDKLQCQIDKLLINCKAEDQANFINAVRIMTYVGNSTGKEALTQINDAISILYTLKVKISSLVLSEKFRFQYSKVSNYNEVKKVKDSLYNSDYLYNLDFLIEIELYYRCALLLKYNMLTECNTGKNEISLIIKEISDDSVQRYFEKYQVVKTEILAHIELARKDANINVEKICNIEKEIAVWLGSVERKIIKANELLNNNSFVLEIKDGKVLSLFSENKLIG
ncbi:MAG: hypothetical protein R3Y26_08835 [Rikenellaceae bacterium]